MPKVSVIIPTFNGETTILETVRSVQKQTFKDWELIIVDDGSTDQTVQLLQTLRDPRIKILFQKNKGVSVARNRAIAQAQGKYIAFLDHDDLWKPDKLTRQVSCLDQDSTIGLLHADSYVFHEDPENAQPIILYDPSPHITNSYHKLLMRCHVGIQTVIVRKEVLDEVGLFDPELLVAADWDLWIRIAKNHRVLHSPERLAFYRDSPHSLSSDLEGMARDQWHIVQKYLLQSEVPAEVQRQGLWEFFKRQPSNLNIAQTYFSREDIPKAIQKLGLWLWSREMCLIAIRQKAVYRALRYYFRAITIRPFAWKNYIDPFKHLVNRSQT